jgi:hypothetical protein
MCGQISERRVKSIRKEKNRKEEKEEWHINRSTSGEWYWKRKWKQDNKESRS